MNKPFDLETVHPLAPKKTPKGSTFTPDAFKLPDPLEAVIAPATPTPEPVTPTVETQEGTPWLVVLCRLASVVSLIAAGTFVAEYFKTPKEVPGMSWLQVVGVASCLGSALSWWVFGEFLVIGSKTLSLLKRIKG